MKRASLFIVVSILFFPLISQAEFGGSLIQGEKIPVTIKEIWSDGRVVLNSQISIRENSYSELRMAFTVIQHDDRDNIDIIKKDLMSKTVYAIPLFFTDNYNSEKHMLTLGSFFGSSSPVVLLVDEKGKSLNEKYLRNGNAVLLPEYHKLYSKRVKIDNVFPSLDKADQYARANGMGMWSQLFEGKNREDIVCRAYYQKVKVLNDRGYGSGGVTGMWHHDGVCYVFADQKANDRRVSGVPETPFISGQVSFYDVTHDRHIGDYTETHDPKNSIMYFDDIECRYDVPGKRCYFSEYVKYMTRAYNSPALVYPY